MPRWLRGYVPNKDVPKERQTHGTERTYTRYVELGIEINSAKIHS